MNNKNNQQRKIRFLSDQPLTFDKKQEVRFGHPGIAKKLYEMILNCPTPFTFGLFGKWGTGKTTILNILQENLKSLKIPVVCFDVWKHESDSFRATFLKELVTQLKSQKAINKNFKLSERLDTTISRAFEGKTKWNKSIIGVTFLFALIALIIGILINKFWPYNLSTYVSILLSGSIVSGFILFLLQHALTTEKVTSIAECFREPQEFEREFKNIVCDNIKSERFLIIIDNLDRTVHEKAVELLSTIKTFLEHDKCIYLIACDDDAIKKHLESVYLKGQNKPSESLSFDPDEFLRKFFNATLRIPDFIDTELQSYTEELLKATGIPELDTSDVAYVITNVYRENPRQIKQFINTLIAHFLLAEERENGQAPLIIPQGAITRNVAFLAKFLIIRQKFLEEYLKIRESYLNVNEMENIGRKEFRDFLRATKPIAVDDIRPFIYLKQSQEELTIPGVRELEMALIDDKREIVYEKMKGIKVNSEQINSLRRFLPSLIERYKNRRIPLLNIVGCSLESLSSHNMQMGQEFYNKIADLMNDEKHLKPELKKLSPAIIFQEVLTRCSKADRFNIISQYIHALGERSEDRKELIISYDYAHVLINELIKHKDWLGENKVILKRHLAEIYYSSPKIIALFKENIDAQRDLITQDCISRFVGTFTIDDIEKISDINDKVDILLELKEMFTSEVVQNIVDTLQNLLKAENQRPYREAKTNFLERIIGVIRVLGPHIASLSDKASLNSFANSINQGFNLAKNWNEKKLFVLIELRMVTMLDDPQKVGMATLIRSFFANSDYDSISYVLTKLTKTEKETIANEHVSIFSQRALQDQQIFDYLYPLVQQETRDQWLIGLINVNFSRAFVTLGKLGYKNFDKKKIVATLLQTISTKTDQDKSTICKAVNEMKCAGDAELKRNYITQIKNLLKNTAKGQQEVGYSALEGAVTYISATAKREIARETIEWLRLLEPANARQPYSIKSIILSWDDLEEPVKNDFIDFIFDKLIKRGINLDSIQLGYEILIKIKPKYEDHILYFDDLFVKMESETNPQLRAELRNGLLKLKPLKMNEKNKDFWTKVDNLGS